MRIPAFLTNGAACAAAQTGDKMERTYISGGTVYDGTGEEPFCGDIVINGSTIEAVLPHKSDRFTEKNGRLVWAQGLFGKPLFEKRTGYSLRPVGGSLETGGAGCICRDDVCTGML